VSKMMIIVAVFAVRVRAYFKDEIRSSSVHLFRLLNKIHMRTYIAL